MAQLGGTFDATQVEPQADFTPVPAGEYLVMATDSEMKATKNGTGQYLQLTYQVLDGPFKNRLIWDRINIQNANATAQEIGQRSLSALCHAVGQLQVQDSSQLHNKPFIVRVSVRSTAEHGESNEVKGYKAASGKTAPVSSRPAATATATRATDTTDAAAQPIPPTAQASSGAARPAWMARQGQ